MEIPTANLPKPAAAMQRCKSARAAVTIYRLGYLARSQVACYIRFARYEDKLTPDDALNGRQGCGPVQIRPMQLAGPLRPDFSEPKYAHIEYIWVAKGATHADRWNLRSGGL